jgi:diadenosine tetraphosphate (Ap4A) HIT family hydrolase
MDKCIFCQDFEKERILYDDSLWVALLDGYPVSEGHTLLIPKRHCETMFNLNEEESSTLY